MDVTGPPRPPTERTSDMSETPDEQRAVPAGESDDVRDEVLLDLDEDQLDTWEDVRDDYAVDPDSTVTRPALAERRQHRDIDDAAPPEEPEDVT